MYVVLLLNYYYGYEDWSPHYHIASGMNYVVADKWRGSTERRSFANMVFFASFNRI